MDAELVRDVLIDGFERVREDLHAVLAGASPATVLHRPAAGANSIGWLAWHLTRIQDDHLAGLAAVLGGEEPPSDWGHERRGQLWLDAGWRERFALPYPDEDTGYGHGADDVARFGVGDPALLDGYHAAVHERTLEVLRSLDADGYRTVVDLRFGPPVTAAVRLVSVLNDTAQHVGQAAYVKGLGLDRLDLL
ncbi:mycothiol transferase [Arthrobacter halodurans]|uniref:DinB family protein n=1 Tax=Arthrobacter halodurans TaxID=516699 RepID=A0ABV4UK56_9MICC